MKNRLFEIILILLVGLMLTAGNAIDWQRTLNYEQAETVHQVISYLKGE